MPKDIVDDLPDPKPEPTLPPAPGDDFVASSITIGSYDGLPVVSIEVRLSTFISLFGLAKIESSVFDVQGPGGFGLSMNSEGGHEYSISRPLIVPSKLPGGFGPNISLASDDSAEFSIGGSALLGSANGFVNSGGGFGFEATALVLGIRAEALARPEEGAALFARRLQQALVQLCDPSLNYPY